MQSFFRKRAALLLLLVVLLAACTAETETPAQPAGAAQPDAAIDESPTSAPPGNEPGELPVTPPPAVAPPVPNAAEAQQYSGTTVNYYSGQIGVGSELDILLIEQFAEETGITVNFVPKSDDTTEDYDVYEVLFEAESPDIDVLALDIIWPASFAAHLVDLGPALGADAEQHFPGIIENNTVDGRLIAMPQFGDFGMLYYRSDLLQQYGFDQPPATWDELEEMAATIQQGERAAGNANFVGFVFQGAAYEGGTCNVLEWVASHGGTIIEDGTVRIDSAAARQALERARGWVGTIAPDNVVSFREEDARELFQRGDAAFMRNWPYAYAMGNTTDSPIHGRFNVAPLPHAGEHRSVGTVGGWQLAVSAYARNQEAATEFVRYLTSADVQKWRAIQGAYVPTIRSVSEDPEVIAALPFLDKLQDVVRVTRPSRETGSFYNEASSVVFQGANAILRGADSAATLEEMDAELAGIVAQAP